MFKHMFKQQSSIAQLRHPCASINKQTSINQFNTYNAAVGPISPLLRPVSPTFDDDEDDSVKFESDCETKDMPIKQQLSNASASHSLNFSSPFAANSLNPLLVLALTPRITSFDLLLQPDEFSKLNKEEQTKAKQEWEQEKKWTGMEHEQKR